MAFPVLVKLPSSRIPEKSLMASEASVRVSPVTYELQTTFSNPSGALNPSTFRSHWLLPLPSKRSFLEVKGREMSMFTTIYAN